MRAREGSGIGQAQINTAACVEEEEVGVVATFSFRRVRAYRKFLCTRRLCKSNTFIKNWLCAI